MNTNESEGVVHLAHGETYFRFDGAHEAPLLVLIHGATVPAWEFDRIVPYLTEAGFRCLRFDLYGHGASARPRRRHDHALFVTQARELLAALGVEQVHGLLGHSLGAALSARLAAEEYIPSARLAMVAPLLDFIGENRAVSLMTAPGLGEVLMPTVIIPGLIRRRTKRYRPLDGGRFVGLFHEQLAKPGFGRSLLSLMRSGALGDQSDCYRALASRGNRLLLLRGDEDNIVTADQLHRVRDLTTRADTRELAGTGHAVMLTHPEIIAPVLVEFFGHEEGE
ncbi:MAG: alpha/beta fold hydrolase [Pseudomonadota bacterium]